MTTDIASRAIALNSLTPRQIEVAQLIGRGWINKEIAAELRVSEQTVKNHLSAIFRELGCCRWEVIQLISYMDAYAACTANQAVPIVNWAMRADQV